MYAFVTIEAPSTAVDFDEQAGREQLHYWRKHPDLHGWMEKLYIEKGGKDEDFNMSPVRLDRADIDQLEAAIIANELPGTSGFFFGYSDGSERDDDLAFIAKARAALASGLTVFYFAWW
jgi:hypothetical protein